MRWSPSTASISTSVLVASLALHAIAVPIINDESALEIRAKTKPAAGGNKPFKAGDFKASSSTYRNSAAQSKNPIHRVQNGRVTKSQPNGKVQKGLDADHIVEGQTVAAAANKAKKKPSPAAVKAAKAVVNSPQNMAFLDKKTNIQKGSSATAAAKDKPVKQNKNVKDYLKSTQKVGEKVASKITGIFKKHGSDANVSKEHDKVLKGNKVKKRELVDIELDLRDLYDLLEERGFSTYEFDELD